MYQKLLHTKGLRLLGGLLGSLLLAAAINVFIVPQGLYGGGAYGLCQVIRTLVLRALDLELPFDLAGVLYFCVNIPLFMLAFRALGREFFLKAAICTAANSLFLAIIPSPAVPVIPDMLTSCMVGGILVGFSGGLVLILCMLRPLGTAEPRELALDLDSLSAEQQRVALVHLSVKWAEQKAGGHNAGA